MGLIFSTHFSIFSYTYSIRNLVIYITTQAERSCSECYEHEILCDRDIIIPPSSLKCLIPKLPHLSDMMQKIWGYFEPTLVEHIQCKQTFVRVLSQTPNHIEFTWSLEETSCNYCCKMH